VKTGLVLPMFTGDASRLRAFAERAERLGFDGVFASDHLFPPGHPERPSLEAFTTLAALGVAHPGLEVGTLVARAGVRPPGLLAKMAASVDDMTGGKFILGLGGGDPGDRPEHEAFGIPADFSLEGRCALLTETVRAVKTLFDGAPWQGGEHTPAMRGPLLPAPSREGGPPVWVGGISDELVQVAARYADGWNGWGISLEEFERKAGLLAEEARAAGRGVEATWAGLAALGGDEAEAGEMAASRRAKGLPEVWTGTTDRLASFVRDLGRAGARWAIFAPVGGDEIVVRIAAAVLPPVCS